MPEPVTVKTFDVLTSYPHQAVRPMTHRACTASTEGGVLTLRGVEGNPWAHVVSYGPTAWLNYTVKGGDQ